jgi:RNA polymerase sigma factor (sigma-70 family)
VSAAAEPLQAERGRLFALAYRMLGSVGEAEDAVQDAYLRWYSEPRAEVLNPPAFLTTMVINRCLDVLKSARRQREQYPGVWLAEPLGAEADNEAWPEARVAGPEEDLQRLESVSFAFMALLQTLSPLERAVYLLAEVFDYPHSEIGAMLQRSPQACRQALRRAKQSLDARKRSNASDQRHRELLVSFVTAVGQGDVDALARLLADDVESRGDGGGYVNAATKPVVGVRAVSRLFAGLAPQIPADLEVRLETVNGWPSALLSAGGVLLAVFQVQVVDDRITRIDNVMNPHKIARVAATWGYRTALTSA